MAQLINNGKAFPKAVKLAALKASKLKANKKRSVAAVAADFNISKSTLCNWKRTAGLNEAVPAGIAAHQKAAATVKAYNTPTVTEYTTATGTTVRTIAYRGRTYR